jgi:hypothetical protein
VAVWAFAMILTCSRMLNAAPVLRMDQSSWCASHVAAFEFFGGVPARMVCDNLKTGVYRPDLYDPKSGRAYAELAAFYGLLIVGSVDRIVESGPPSLTATDSVIDIHAVAIDTLLGKKPDLNRRILSRRTHARVTDLHSTPDFRRSRRPRRKLSARNYAIPDESNGHIKRTYKTDEIARISPRQFHTEARLRSSGMTMAKTHTQTRRNALTRCCRFRCAVVPAPETSVPFCILGKLDALAKQILNMRSKLGVTAQGR